jgi:simple sugar transport system ATP-binding protein
VTGAPILLQLQDIHKRFGTVQALSGAGLVVRAGEVHALLGENGAGKTTLMHVASGMVAPDSGEILVDGVPRRLRSPRDARDAGIGLVHQHFTSISALTVAENIALFAGWDVRPRELARRVGALTQRLNLPLDPAARAGTLPVALLQRLEIVKALAADARVLLLDEPTGVLAPSEVDELLVRTRAFAEAGGAVVLITHKLDEVLRAADQVTVLRRGALVLESGVQGLGVGELARAMIGEATILDEPVPLSLAVGNAPRRVHVAGLEVARESGLGMAVRQASLELRAGEIVAMAGIEGSGQRELLRAIAGVLPVFRGTREVALPLAFVPEDRTTEGLIPELSLTENVVLGLGRSAPWVRRGRLDWSAATRRTAEMIAGFGVRAAGPDVPAATLSGGNQQKLIIARALERRPEVIIAENPTRGLDVLATREVHDRLREAAARGVAVLLYSNDLDEVMTLGQRVVVMVRGTLREAPAGATRGELGALMLGAGESSAA